MRLGSAVLVCSAFLTTSARNPFRSISALAALLVTVVGALVFSAWFTGMDFLKSMHPQWVAMKTGTAMCFMLSGISLWLQREESRSPAAARGSRLLAAVVLVTGIVTLLEYGFDMELGIDSIVYFLPHSGPDSIGRMSLGAGINFALTGLALLAVDTDIHGRYRPSEFLMLVVGVISLFATMGYVYGATSLYQFMPFSTMAVHTAAMFLVLTVGIIGARPRRGMVAILTTPNGGGYMARRLIPVVVVLITGMGWLRWQGELAGYYDTALGLALFTTTNLITLTGVIWYVAGLYNRVDAERHDAQLRFRRVFEAAPTAMILIGPDGCIDLANRQAETLFGYDAEGLRGMSVETLVPESYRPQHPEMRHAFVSHPTVYAMGRSRDVHVQRSDGSLVPVEVGLGPVQERHGTSVLAVVLDISERKRAEAELKENERFLATLVSNLPGMVYSCENDRDWTMTFVSGGCRELTGYAPDELMHNRVKAYAELIHPDDRASVWDQVQAALNGRRPFLMEYRIVCRDGTVKWIWEQGRMAETVSGGDTMLEGFIMDISARRFAEESLRTANLRLEQRVAERTARLAASNQELEAFSYSVSHDLRAPLRAVDGFSRVLLQNYSGVLDEQGRHYLARVRAGTQRMGELIDDLLKLSRVTRSELAFDQVDLSAIARDVLAELGRNHPQREIELSVQPDVTVRGDRNLLRILLQQLLANAWKFTRKQQRPRIEFGTTANNDGSAFFVRDNGAGFDMAYANRLFGAFQRLHSADEFEGTGIGLATAQRIVYRHGGRIWAEGAVDQGATFHFTLHPHEEENRP